MGGFICSIVSLMGNVRMPLGRYRRYREIRLLRFDEIPSSFLGKRLGCSITAGGVLYSVLFRGGIPVLLTVCVTGSVANLGRKDGCEGTRDYLESRISGWRLVTK